MKKFTSMLLLLTMLSIAESQGQTVWHNPLQKSKESFIQNQGWNEDGGNYHRFPNRAEKKIRNKVWKLSCQSAGLAIRFITDAQDIRVKYKVKGAFNMPHMPSTGVSGVDLYRCKDNSFCFGNYAFGDTIRYQYSTTSEKAEEYILYLPLYNEVTFLEIGVPAEQFFEWIPTRKEKPLVLYGTSIAQGACASRPGMAWSNIVSRQLNVPLINLGFSGNGKLEPEIIELICEQDASVFILDCMPNMGAIDSPEITRRVVEAVRRIRKQHKAPILLVEHAGNGNQFTNQTMNEQCRRCNRAQQKAFDQLKKEGVKKLFYLPQKKLNFHPNSWVDYVHPSDFGMMQQATALLKVLRTLTK